ncbi:MAG TPA: hypothetical protein VF950_16740 [Planctomycetota bacterium]
MTLVETALFGILLGVALLVWHLQGMNKRMDRLADILEKKP